MAIDALARVVDEYEDPAGMVLVGHSLGGAVTMGYLAHHPETARRKVGAAVLVSTPIKQFAHAVAGRWPGAGIEARLLGRAIQYLIESDAIDRRLAKDVGSEADTLSYRVVRVGFGPNASPSQVRFVRNVIASVPPQVRVDAFRAMTTYDVEPHLDGIEHPCLIVIGDEDRLVNPEESRLLAERLAGSETLVLPEVGHAAFLEVPNTFNAAVLGFAERHLRGRPEADSA
jgi:pimeloyl-ACP methyl ester carboxylesterase